MKSLALSLALLLIVPFCVLQTKAQNVLEVGINGFTCSMCAYGTEAALAKLSFVDSVQMDIETTTARIYVQADKADWDAVAAAIVDAGFSVRSFAVLGKFTVKSSPNELISMTVANQTVLVVRNPDSQQSADRLTLVDAAFLPVKEAKSWKKDIEKADKAANISSKQKVYHAILP